MPCFHCPSPKTNENRAELNLLRVASPAKRTHVCTHTHTCLAKKSSEPRGVVVSSAFFQSMSLMELIIVTPISANTGPLRTRGSSKTAAACFPRKHGEGPWTNLHRATYTDQVAQSHLRRQVRLPRATCKEYLTRRCFAWGNLHRATCRSTASTASTAALARCAVHVAGVGWPARCRGSVLPLVSWPAPSVEQGRAVSLQAGCKGNRRAREAGGADMRHVAQ